MKTKEQVIREYDKLIRYISRLWHTTTPVSTIRDLLRQAEIAKDNEMNAIDPDYVNRSPLYR